MLCGCGEKVNENKPVAEVKAEAAKMDAKQLEAKVEACKKFIEGQKAEVEKVMAKIKEIPLTEMLGDKAKNLKAEADKIGESISKVSAQLEAYAKELEAKKSAK